MPRTEQDLIVQSLKMLGAVGAGQTPSAEDVETVRGYVEPRIAQLSSKRVAYISDSDDIPDDQFLPIAALVANAAGPEFGKPFDQTIDDREEGTLRALNRAQGSRPLKVDYF